MTDSARWFILIIVLAFLALVYLLSPVLMPFLVAFLLAYFLDPLVTKLRKLKVPRIISALLVLIIALIVLLALIFTLVPALEKQIVVFVHQLPSIINWVETVAVPWVNNKLGLHITLDMQLFKSMIVGHVTGASNFSQVVVKTVFSSGFVAFEILMNIILIPVVTIYLLVDWEKVTHQGKKLLPFPGKKREVAVKLIQECGDVLAGFFRGQLLVMIGLAIVYSVGLALTGLDFALLIGVSAGILSVVPYLGFISGLLVAIIASAIQFGTWWHIIAILAVFAVGEVCESFIFSPLFVGDRIGLHPVAVIFAVLAGGKLFGFVGVLLALPAAAVIMVFFRYLQSRYFADEEIESQEDLV